MDRRKTIKPRHTVVEILEKMQSDADHVYNGDLQNNILAIFSKLGADDKKTYLRRSLILLWENQITLAKVGLHEVVIDAETRIDPSSVIMERQSIEEVNYTEQAKLKTWVQKVIFVSSMLGIIFFVIAAYMTGNDAVVDGSLFTNIKNIFSVIF